jgi:hypothetical protein
MQIAVSTGHPILSSLRMPLNILAKIGDEAVRDYLLDYHRRGITSKHQISKLLLEEHKISLRYVIFLFVHVRH